MPQQLIIELVYWDIFWINIFPADTGISKSISPRDIITGLKLDLQNHFKLEFVGYVHTHEQHNNKMKDRKIGSLALLPNVNEQRGHYFLSLLTGRVINQRKFTPLPMPEEVKERAHCLEHCNKAGRGLIFTDRDKKPIF